jgi:hypothetical protein
MYDVADRNLDTVSVATEMLVVRRIIMHPEDNASGEIRDQRIQF